MQRLDNLTDQIACKIEVLDSYERQQRGVEVHLVWHAVDAADQCLGECVSVGSLLQDEGGQELCLQLREVVVSVVSLLISDPDDHELELVDLADRFLDLLWRLLVLNLGTGLVVHLVLLGSEGWVRLHLLCFDHS